MRKDKISTMYDVRKNKNKNDGVSDDKITDQKRYVEFYVYVAGM